MEEKEMLERIERLEKVVTELTRVVYVHATAIATITREFGIHYHLRDGQTLPKILSTGDSFLKYVTQMSNLDHDVRPQIEQYESDPQTFLKNNYGDLYYWPWE